MSSGGRGSTVTAVPHADYLRHEIADLPTIKAHCDDSIGAEGSARFTPHRLASLVPAIDQALPCRSQSRSRIYHLVLRLSHDHSA